MSDAPYNLEIQFATQGHANRASLTPGSKRVSASTIGFVSDDYGKIFGAFLCMITLASTFDERK
jgi:D-aminopeptidase